MYYLELPFILLEENLVNKVKPVDQVQSSSLNNSDEHLNKSYKKFEAAPQEVRGVPAKKPVPDYFL